jgi:hypothetical protein
MMPKALDAEKTDDNPNHSQNGNQSDDLPFEVSRATMKVYLHNLVCDKIVPEYRIYCVGRHLHKVDIDYQEACPATSRRSPRDHPSFSGRPAKWGTVRRSPRDHLSSSEQATKRGTKKKCMLCVQPEPAIVSDTPIKTMDGNPLGQGRDISLDNQGRPRMDYSNPAKVNDHKVNSRV